MGAKGDEPFLGKNQRAEENRFKRGSFPAKLGKATFPSSGLET